jgi:hypothetical protein
MTYNCGRWGKAKKSSVGTDTEKSLKVKCNYGRIQSIRCCDCREAIP